LGSEAKQDEEMEHGRGCMPGLFAGLLHLHSSGYCHWPAVTGFTKNFTDVAVRTQTMNNLSQCAKGIYLAHDFYKKLPPYYGIYGPPEKNTPFSFHTYLLPFVDQTPLSNQTSPAPFAIIPSYLAPMVPTESAHGSGAANFVINMRLYYTKGGLGMLTTGTDVIYPRMPDTFGDGMSNTLLFATKYQNCGMNGGSLWADSNAQNSLTAATFGVSMALWQKAPAQAVCDPAAGTAVSFTVESIQVAMCDTRVQSLSSGVSAATWQALHTPSAGDVVGPDWEN
jgi:hypothetical protein